MPKTILIVGVEKEVYQTIQEWLTGRDAVCEYIEETKEATAWLLREKPWIVVLDLDHWEGRKLAQKIKNQPELSDLKLVALSSGVDPRQVTEHVFGENFADCYVRTPLKRGVLDQWFLEQLSGGVPEFELQDVDSAASEEYSNFAELLDKIERLEAENFEKAEKLAASKKNIAMLNRRLKEADVKDGIDGRSSAENWEDVHEQKKILSANFEGELTEAKNIIHELQETRDAKVAQINQLHVDLQLSREAVSTLQLRVQKAEKRLAEAQSLAIERDQQVHRESIALQRQLSALQHNLQATQNREAELNQKIGRLEMRLDSQQESESIISVLREKVRKESEKNLQMEQRLRSSQDISSEQDMKIAALAKEEQRLKVKLKEALIKAEEKSKASFSSTGSDSIDIKNLRMALLEKDREIERQKVILEQTYRALEKAVEEQEEAEILLEELKGGTDLVASLKTKLEEGQEELENTKRKLATLEETYAVSSETQEIVQGLQGTIQELEASFEKERAKERDEKREKSLQFEKDKTDLEEEKRRLEKELAEKEKEFLQEKELWQDAQLKSAQKSKQWNQEREEIRKENENRIQALEAKHAEELLEVQQLLQQNLEKFLEEKDENEFSIKQAFSAEKQEYLAEKGMLQSEKELLETRLEEKTEQLVSKEKEALILNQKMEEIELSQAQTLQELQDKLQEREAFISSQKESLAFQEEALGAKEDLIEALSLQKESLENTIQGLEQKFQAEKSSLKDKIVSLQEEKLAQEHLISKHLEGQGENRENNRELVEEVLNSKREQEILRRTMEDAQAMAEELEASLEAEYDDFEKEKEELKREQKAFFAQKEELEDQVKILEEQAALVITERDEAIVKFDALTEDVRVAKEELKLHQEKQEMLQVEMEAQSQKSIELQEKIEQLKDQLVEKDSIAEQKLEALERSLEKAKQATIEQKEEQEHLFQREISQLSREKEQLQEQIDLLNRENATENMAVLTRLQDEKAALQNELSDAKAQKQHLLGEKNELEIRLEQVREELQGAREQIASLKEDYEQLQASLDSVEKERSAMLSSQKKELTAIEQAKADLALELADVQEKYSELQKQNEIQNSMVNSAALAELQRNLQLKEAEHLELKLLADEQSEKIISLQEQAEQWSAMRAEMQAELQENKITLQALAQEANEKQMSHQFDRAELLNQLDTLSEKVEKQQSQIQELQAEDKNKRLSALQIKCDDLEDEVQSLEFERGFIQSSSRELVQKTQLLKEKALRRQTQLQNRLKERDDEVQRLKLQLQQMNKGLSSIFVSRPKFRA